MIFRNFLIKKVFYFLLYIVFFNLNYNSIAQCDIKNKAFKLGEKLQYEISYNWGLIWVNAGKVTFEVKEAIYSGKKVYHFKGTGFSYKKYDWIYKVRDYYESYAKKSNLNPLKFVRNTSEGKYKVNNVYHFDYAKNRIYTSSENSKKALVKDTLKLKKCTFDLISAVYYARNVDLSKYKKNDKIPLTFVIDNKIYTLYGRYLGKEVIKTKKQTKYRCIKLKLLLVEGTIFKGGEDLVVWVTDDKNRIPIKISAKILVGSIKVYLSSTTGLRYKLNSKI